MPLNFTQGITNLGGSFKDVVGNIARAYFCIRVVDEKYFDDLKNKDNNDINSAYLDAQEKTTKLEQTLLGEAQDKLSQNGLSSLSSSLDTDLVDINYMVYRVKYNPASLHYSSTGQGDRLANLDNMGAGSMVRKYRQPVSTSLTVKFIFEAINNADAFITDSETLLSITPGNLISTASDIYNKAKGKAGEVYNVQLQTEAILSLLARPETRDVIFVWGGNIFRGNVGRVGVNYKMFSKAGFPILAEVDLTIRQSSAAQFKHEAENWQKVLEQFANETQKDSLEL